MKNLFFLSIVIILSASTTFAQGEYLGNGKSGIGVGGGIVFDDGEKAKSFQIGYSSMGIIDFNFGVTEVISNNFSKNFGFTVHPFNNKNKVLKLSIVASYQILDYRYVDMEVISIIPILHTDSRWGSSIIVKPYVGVGLVNITKRENEENVFYQSGLSFYINNKKDPIVFLDLGLGRYDGETNFGLNLGLIFPF